MGHWSDDLVEPLAARIGSDIDREHLRAALAKAATHIELLSGRSFDGTSQQTLNLEAGGLPFVGIPDLQVQGNFESNFEVWPVPDPVNSHIATVLQLGRFDASANRALSIGNALWRAGHLVAAASRAGLLSRDFLLSWLRNNFDSEQRVLFLKRLVDPSNQINVPIVAAQAGGWCFQVTRRLLWLTNDTPDEQRLLEPLIDQEGGLLALAGVEPLLIAARITSHPADWVFSARIWPSVDAVALPGARPWQRLAPAIHSHGVPILTIDEASSPAEMACQLLLLAYWHRYIDADEPGLAEGISSAYPKAVERIKRSTGAPDTRSAAAHLMGGLLRPGFDPVLGAEYTRRYVSRKATIAILQYQKADRLGASPWELIGVSERSYYKLLKRFAPKLGRRYQVDDTVLDQIRNYLTKKDRQTDQHTAAMDLLQSRGFTWAAARKWLQRHRIEDVQSAWPRPRLKVG